VLIEAYSYSPRDKKVYFLVNKKLTTRKSVSCGFMSKLRGDKKHRLFSAVSPEVAIEYVVRQGRLAELP
jgi:hypothetical protein